MNTSLDFIVVDYISNNSTSAYFIDHLFYRFFIYSNIFIMVSSSFIFCFKWFFEIDYRPLTIKIHDYYII